mmetsp:Transcript_5831/g.22244  ORF Transcript_5831/g.22244 Transcript_5831/m.22244 type:complete len:218 (-) Transcript_5831:573-1226(-)
MRSVTSRASWSLPPDPRLRLPTTDAQLLRTLSTPPKELPEYTLFILLSRCCKVCDSGPALKSPTRTTASPVRASLAMIFSTLYAVASPPQRPPVPTGRGPWWLTKRSVLLVTLFCRRIHITALVPYHWSLRSSPTSCAPSESKVQLVFLKATHMAWGPTRAPYSPIRPPSSMTLAMPSHSWKPITSNFAGEEASAMSRPALPPLPRRMPKRFHQKRL